jgi:hypothetical protein
VAAGADHLVAVGGTDAGPLQAEIHVDGAVGAADHESGLGVEEGQRGDRHVAGEDADRFGEHRRLEVARVVAIERAVGGGDDDPVGLAGQQHLGDDLVLRKPRQGRRGQVDLLGAGEQVALNDGARDARDAGGIDGDEGARRPLDGAAHPVVHGDDRVFGDLLGLANLPLRLTPIRTARDVFLSRRRVSRWSLTF